jgi:hypothetical protein
MMQLFIGHIQGKMFDTPNESGQGRSQETFSPNYSENP